MRCVVPNCNNNSKTTSKEIAFHKFPKDASLRATWLLVLRKAGSQITDAGAKTVCSQHFQRVDLSVSSSGRRQLRAGAVPVLNMPDSAIDYGSMKAATSNDVKACRICFGTDCKLFYMNGHKTLYTAYESLTGLLLEHEEHLPQYLCAECALQVLDCARFRTRSLRAHLTLVEIARNHDCITLALIQSIKKNQNAHNESDSDDEVSQTENTYNPENLNYFCENVTVNEIMTENNNLKNNILFAKHSNGDGTACSSSLYEDTNRNKIEKEDMENQNLVNAKDTTEGTTAYMSSLLEDVGDIKIEYMDMDNQGLLKVNNMKNDSMVDVPSLRKTNNIIKTENDDVDNQNYLSADDSNNDDLSADDDIVPKKNNTNNELHSKIHKDEKSYSFAVCSETLSQKTNLIENERNADIIPVSDDVDNKSSNENKHFDMSQRTECNAKPYSCDVCDKTFFTQATLCQHGRIHSNEKPHSSDDVNKGFDNEIKLTLHEKPFSCDVCNKTFLTKCSVSRHVQMHSGEKPYTCDVCHKSFCSKGVLRTHIRIHSGVTYSCNICDKEFKKKENYTSHMRLHSGEKPYSCDVCNKAFNTRSTLNTHLRAHSDEKPYSCDICNKSFRRIDYLSQHLTVHSGKKPFSCDVCSVAFNKSNNLAKHMRIHSGEKPYACEICKKLFNRKHDLAKHLGTHSNRRSFLCEVCNKGFHRKDCLVNHLRQHFGVTPYSCSFCSKTFVQKCNLKKHIRRAHSKRSKLYN